MSNVKNRGADNTPKKTEETVSIERLANVGERVVTAKGELLIKEPTLEQVIVLLTYLMPIADSLKGVNDKGNKEFLSELVTKPEVKEAFRKVAASLANVQEDFFVDLGITDWLKVFVAIKKVVNWDELNELFSQLDLINLLNQLQ